MSIPTPVARTKDPIWRVFSQGFGRRVNVTERKFVETLFYQGRRVTIHYLTFTSFTYLSLKTFYLKVFITGGKDVEKTMTFTDSGSPDSRTPDLLRGYLSFSLFPMKNTLPDRSFPKNVS